MPPAGPALGRIPSGVPWRVGRLFTPDLVCRRVTDIAPAHLQALGVLALIVDLDNTLTRWNDQACAPDVAEWLRAVRASGVSVCVVSNNGPERVGRFCEGLGAGAVPWIAHAGKPRRSAYLRAAARLSADPARTAVVGDQVFTDVLGGKRARMLTILVTPLGRREFPLTRAVRVVERLWLQRLRAAGGLQTLEPL